MNESAADTGSSTTSSQERCKSAEDILNEINGEIGRFSALKLTELKAELERFIIERQTANTQYGSKFSEFVSRWNDEGTQIDRLHSTLICAYPDWKDRLKAKVCSIRVVLNDLETKIEALKTCKGKNESKRDQKSEQLVTASATLEKWKKATTGIDEQLKKNQDWVTQIQNLSQGKEHAFRLYLLWFKLIPAHNRLRPDDHPSPDYGAESPEALCGQSKEQSQGESACCPGPTEQREAPWIIDTAAYLETLDCAFADYKSAKDAYGLAVSDFEKDKDDLASLTKELTDKTASLDDDVKKNLTDQTMK